MNKKIILILALIGTTISFDQKIYGDTTISNQALSVNEENPTPGTPAKEQQARINPPKNNAPDTQDVPQTKGMFGPKALLNRLDRTVAEIDQSAGSQTSNVMTGIFSAIGGSFLLLGVIFIATRIYEGNKEEKKKVEAAKKSLEEAIRKEYPQEEREPEEDYETRIRAFLDKAQELQEKNKPKSDESADDYSKRILELAGEQGIISTEESRKVKVAEEAMLDAIGRTNPKYGDESDDEYDRRIKSIFERTKAIRSENKPRADESAEDYTRRILEVAAKNNFISRTLVEPTPPAQDKSPEEADVAAPRQTTLPTRPSSVPRLRIKAALQGITANTAAKDEDPQSARSTDSDSRRSLFDQADEGDQTSRPAAQRDTATRIMGPELLTASTRRTFGTQTDLEKISQGIQTAREAKPIRIDRPMTADQHKPSERRVRFRDKQPVALDRRPADGTRITRGGRAWTVH